MNYYAMIHTKGPQKGKLCIGTGAQWFHVYTKLKAAKQLRQLGEAIVKVEIKKKSEEKMTEILEEVLCQI